MLKKTDFLNREMCVDGCYHVVAVFWGPVEELLAGDRSPHTSLLGVCQGDLSPSTHHRHDSIRHNGPETEERWRIEMELYMHNTAQPGSEVGFYISTCKCLFQTAHQSH